MNLLNWICFDIGPIIMDLVIAVIYFGVAFDKIFGFLVLGCIGSYFCTTLSFSQTRRKFRKEANEKNNDTSSRAVDSLLNIEQVKANVNEDYEHKLYEEKILAEQNSKTKLNNAQAFEDLAKSVVMIGGQSIGTLLCIKYVLDGNFSVGDYVMFGTYMSQLYRPVSRMVNMYRWIQNAYVNTENLLELLAEKPERADPSPIAKVILPDRPLSMAVENVSFRYQSENRQILNKISFEIPAGQTWALVGESGCGKSTLSRLFTGFIEPQSGRVLINGIDLNKIGRKQVRKQIATVSQDCPLFNASIRENINYAQLDASYNDSIKAAKNAELQFEKFENGIESEVGERGLALSGGEKQRVAIARVLLKNPNAIILDEATSGKV